MDKKELRKIYREKRNGLSIQALHKMEDLLLIRFQQLGLFIPSIIMTYAPIESNQEYNPQLITDYCFFKNPELELVYPVMEKDCLLKPVLVNENTLFEQNSYGIDEPVDGLSILPGEIDMVIVPLLAFDMMGNRVGYGRGCYDRFLKSCKEDVIKIGFGFFDAVSSISDINEYDVTLDYCITPEKSYHF